ncbi:NAD(P)-binding protein [Gonapodya prolifera JEL478]|uniref:NAD(P)-binding protein n=1 Tax=Gonapodya prolifera (strain JEL478) TaxID=1344416 RepID=A0A139A9B7_GONPJ|nr:NAD(P)-binding protein [Gonapodya prolifera JEL478]|eukprot:KXS13412.1 NAD(P)-binding protein [Gonapodya prolifera JEL478]
MDAHSLPPIAPYKHLHDSPKGVGDARPTAAQIVRDLELEGTMTDRTVLVSGFTTGIGLETARAMALTGTQMVLAGKDTAAFPKVAREISTMWGKEAIVVEMDLADFASVRKAAEEIRSKVKRINFAIFNAGIMTRTYLKTPQGHDITFGVNYLGHFLLFHLIKDLLLPLSPSPDSPSSRLVTLSSLGHLAGPLDMPWIKGGHYDEAKHDHMHAYHQSKLATLYMATEIDRRFSARGLRAFAVSPGTTITPLCDALPPEVLATIGPESGNPIVKSNAQGAATSVWACLAPDLEGMGGLYLEDEAVAGPATPGSGAGAGYATHAYDGEAAKKLWEETCEMVGIGKN